MHSSGTCKSCLLIGGFRQKEHDRLNTPAPQQNYFDVPLRAVEQNKPERYRIQCQRCKTKFDPRKVAMVAAICQYCWTPEEAQPNWQAHYRWNRDLR